MANGKLHEIYYDISGATLKIPVITSEIKATNS